uniref:hypothetical protein n=1 Tax=Halarcobacter sp. TaxID=2321133 RepID=UPI003A92C56A
MENINWDKLQAYSGDTKKSFEELCYQIVSEKFKDDILNGAILTSVDDSGGGDGVEFYLTYANGDIYGWQAKYFCRLNEGGRKEQIKKSLQIAYDKHPNIKKWYLCSQCNFTPDEKKWFNDDLANLTKNGRTVLPTNHNVELIHWGESELLNYLKEYPAIHRFFFSEKFLTQEWFKNRYKIDISKTQIKAKYISEIHIQTDIDMTICKILGGNRLIEVLERTMEQHQVLMYAEEYKQSYLKLFSDNVNIQYKNIQIVFRKFLQDKENIIEIAINKLEEIKKIISIKNEQKLKAKINEFEEYINSLKEFHKKYDDLSESDLCEPIKHIKIEKDDKDKIEEENRKRKKVRDILFSPLYDLSEYTISSLEGVFRIFNLLDENELHISGEAGMGKTHVSFNIYENLIVHQKEPAIFILAKDIYTNQSLENQLKDNFSIPVDWSFDDFLGALEISARVYKVKIPIIIDGLNESTHWNSVWKNGLEKFILKLKQYPHIVLVTTYRNSYEDQLFPNKYFSYDDRWRLKKYIIGFKGLNWKAIETYFKFYKIKLENHSNAIGYFEHPLHLKIFCETKNPSRNKVVKVSFQNEDLFDVFDEYIQISNENITTLLKELDPKYNNDFTRKKLLQLSKYFWENNTRGMPRSEKLFSDEELRVFEGENLLIYRDWNIDNDKEEIQFTYDLLGGYFISKYLIFTYEEYYPYLKYKSNNWFINSVKTGLEFFIPERGTELIENGLTSINKKIGKKDPLLKFIKSKDFRKKLLEKNTEHPLYDDILRTITILIIKKANIFLFNTLENERAKKYSIESLFEINSKFIKDNEDLIKNFLKNEFLSNKKHLFDLSTNVEFDIKHPLNFHFWSDLIKNLSMLERDLFWSEYIRKNHSWYGNSYFTSFVLDFEEACKREKELSDRIHIAAKKVMWIFTTNIRRLRDEATRALYYYARKYPKDFLDLLKYSIDINDPYVVERMLAVTYGLAMARQNDFKDQSYTKNCLPLYGKFLFDTIFSNEAKHHTTHILARDYAKRTIDISLIHHSSLLTDLEKELIKYPLKNYYHTEWKVSEDKDERLYRGGNAPIHMDFGNYTIGRLIDGRRNYDSEHNEYKEVKGQIYWRIYDLGYSLEKFGEIDKQIANDSWHYSNHENAEKIDRYGKKYSWIAFYEMAGYRSDLGLLKKWEDEDELRVSDADIDPSFPIRLREYNLFEEINKNTFLGNLKEEAEKWYLTDSDLDISSYTEINSNLGISENNDWLLLKGTISQKDKEDQTRDVHIAINAIIMNDEEYTKTKNLTDKHNDYSFGYIENVEDHYIYDGEIHWCDLIPNDYTRDFQISYNHRDVEKTKKELRISNNGEEISKEEMEKLKKNEMEYLDQALEQHSDNETEIDLPLFLLGNDNDELRKKIADSLGYTVSYDDISYVEEDYDTCELTIETCIFRNSWESHHSEIISSGETIVPSKKISNTFELYLKPQTSDLYNLDEEIISTSFKFGEGYDGKSTFTYIRKDYLEKYLKEENKKLVWLQWTEKRYFPNGVKKLSHTGEHEKTEYRNYYKIIK